MKRRSIFSSTILQKNKINVLMLFGFFLCSFFSFSQVKDKQVYSEKTILLLSELKNQVSEIQEMNSSLLSFSGNEKDKEIFEISLNEKNQNIIVYIAHSLEEVCTIENCLKEISIIVSPINSKLSQKFLVLHRENLEKQSAK